MLSDSSRRRAVALLGVLAVVVLLAVGVSLRGGSTNRTASGPECQATVGATSFPLDGEQAANATTIAGSGKRLGLPDHAVTIALAAALQESGLHNLPYGDRDSLGVFQQRPSQGWGTTAAILTPRSAAAAFYRRLAGVTGWQSLSVTEAAQRVQHSCAPNAYAGWEPEARALAQVLTGEVPAGLRCRFDPKPGGVGHAGLDRALRDELGTPAAGTSVTPARGWTVAAWLVGHGRAHGITSVQFNGRRWTAAGGTWQPVTSVDPVVRYA